MEVLPSTARAAPRLLLSLDDEVAGRFSARLPDAGGSLVGVGVGVAPVVTENDWTVSPAPPVHGSKPACTLVRYQPDCA